MLCSCSSWASRSRQRAISSACAARATSLAFSAGGLGRLIVPVVGSASPAVRGGRRCSWLLGLTLQMEVHERIGDPYQFIHQYRRHDRVRPSAPLAPENVGLRRKIAHAPVDVAVSLLHGSLGFRYPHPLVRLLDIDPLDALCRSYPHGSWLSFVRRTCVYRMLVAMLPEHTSDCQAIIFYLFFNSDKFSVQFFGCKWTSSATHNII